MAKTSGLGDSFFVNQYDVSGDVNSVDSISAEIATLDVTGINKYAVERIAGQSTAKVDFTSFFNTSAGQIHSALSGLATTNVQATYLNGNTLGNPAASIVGKQLNYDATRSSNGELKTKCTIVSNGYNLEWGQQLTAGIRTDTTATNGTSIDTTSSASFGAQAYLHVFSFTGTSVTITIEDSANNSTWATLATFTVVTAPGFQRIATGLTETVDRYVRVKTTGTFTNVSFSVNFVKNTFASESF